ncbi:unnamed protein product [Effrenium voratum]|uniref:Uncharacterized protein n=1 Tax=Effrenium voratum TaxID=2562239 RepID=A0AA36N062_9DINO|nr:unnamed protein product [Effrenium voratum]
MAVAQRLLQCRYLRLVFRGRELEANSALEANLGHGDTIDAVAQQLEVASTDQAFALFVAGGPSPVLLWGNEIAGGYSNVRETRIKKIRGHLEKEVRSDGTVVTWGNPLRGGESTQVQERLTEVREISANDGAFAAIRNFGGDSTKVQEQLRNVCELQGNRYAFAALLADGSVVTWGDPRKGGDSRQVSEALQQVQRIHAAPQAFAAIRADGSLVTWGDPLFGGDSSEISEQLDFL